MTQPAAAWTARLGLLVVATPGGLAGFFEELAAGHAAGHPDAEIRAALAGRYDAYPRGVLRIGRRSSDREPRPPEGFLPGDLHRPRRHDRAGDRPAKQARSQGDVAQPNTRLPRIAAAVAAEDRVSEAGNVTVRYLSRLRHIGVGRTNAGKPVRLLIADDHVRVMGLDGSLLRGARPGPGSRLPAAPALVVDHLRHLSTMS